MNPLKEPDGSPRVKLEREESGDVNSQDIKTEIDGLIDNEGEFFDCISARNILILVFSAGDSNKSPCEGPGSMKSERLSSDSNDILDPQTGLRGPSLPMSVRIPPSCSPCPLCPFVSVDHFFLR